VTLPEFFIALDLETTGLNPLEDKIIEVGAVKMKPDGTVVEEFQSLVNPGVPLPEIIKELTGIQEEWLKTAPPIESLKEGLDEFMRDWPILGHSVQFDVNFLRQNQMAFNNPILDTFQLSHCFLQDENSYSLEILSEKYGLLHENKHRALDDTKVAIELYKMLLDKIRELPGFLQTDLDAFLEKSTWEWKSTIQKTLKEVSSTPYREIKTISSGIKCNPPNEALKSVIEAGWDRPSALLIESPNYDLENLVCTLVESSEAMGEHTLLATPHPEKISSDARVKHLHHPSHYLCVKRWKEFLEKTHFTDQETTLGIKIKLWLDHTKTGEKGELHLAENEYVLWNSISGMHHLYGESCEETCFYHQARQAALYAPLLVVPHRLLAESSLRSTPLIPHRDRLMIERIEEFEGQVFQAWTKYFSLDHFLSYLSEKESSLISRFEILFGLLGMLVEKYKDPESFGNQIMLTDSLLHTFEGKNIKDMLENMAQELQTLLEATPNALSGQLLQKEWMTFQKALDPKPTHLAWITLSREGIPFVHSCPTHVEQLLQQTLWEKQSHLIGISRFGKFQNSFDFLKKRLGLPSHTEEESFLVEETKEKIELHSYLSLPGIYKEENRNETLECIEKIIESTRENEPRNFFLLMNSLQAIEQMAEGKLDRLKKGGVKILIQGRNGGVGKIGEMLKKNSGKMLLIGSEKLYHSILGDSETSIHELMLHRFPFLPPSHPVQEAQCKTYKNGFMEYSLPCAVLKFKKILYEFGQNPGAEKIHILDPRFENYEGTFQKSLQETIEIKEAQ